MPGWPGSTPPNFPPSTPRRPASIRSPRRSSACRFPARPVMRRICRCGMSIPAHPISSISTLPSPSCAPGWRIRARKNWARTSNTICMYSPITAFACGAMCTTPCCRAMCWKAISATTWNRWPRATSAPKPSLMRTSPARAHEEAGQPFNLGSPKQLAEILFDKKGIKPLKKTPGGAPSTDEETLEKLALDYPLPKIILDYRGVSKLKSTYTDKLPKMVNARTGRVHTNYGQAVAVTGRLSSNDPNLQNIPVRTAEGRRIREAFIAPAGSKILSADYSQIELRIMAHLSGDVGLLKAFADGEDVHRATAAEVFGVERSQVSSEQRRYAKVINFGLIYGMSAFGLAGNLGIERSAAGAYIDRYFARYPVVQQHMERTRAEAHDRGYVETVFGRRLWLPDIRSGNQARRQGAERAAIKAPMQGTAADLIKLAMIAVQGWLEKETLATKLIMQVHDELVLEVPDSELARVQREIPALMTGVAKLDVPLVAEPGVGVNWEEAH